MNAGGKDRYLLVDGHSVIFAWDDLRGVHERDRTAARERLVRQLQDYQDFTGVRVVLVFDGRGPSRSKGKPARDSIQVIYSPDGRTADSVIERLVAAHGQRAEITVATADNMERQTVITFGAFCIDPFRLETLLEEAESQLAQELRRRHRRL